MSDDPESVPAYWIQGIARRLGPEEPIVLRAFEAAGLDPAAVFVTEASVNYRQELAFLNSVVRQSGRDLTAVELGVAMDPRRTSLLSYLLLNSVTLGDGLRNVARYVRLVRGAARSRLERQGDHVAFVISHQDPLVHRDRDHAEFVIGAALAAFRIATGRQVRPVAARFIHERRSHEGEVARILGGPVHFGCERLELVLPSDALQLDLVEADITLLSILLKHAERQLEESRIIRPALRHRVERALIGTLHHEPPSADAIASELGLSLRTLTRRLAAEGCTYRQVIDDLRLRLAESYLADPAVRLAEIAFLLGFADQSSFTTAFKRWTGQTPRERRQALAT